MTPPEHEPIFLRPAEAAALAGLSTRAIYRAVQRGELQAARLCSRLRIPRAAFDEWVERNRVPPAEPQPPAAVSPPRTDLRRTASKVTGGDSPSRLLVHRRKVRRPIAANPR